MNKAWCIWCENGKQYPTKYKENNIVWIHEKCFEELVDFNEDLEEVKNILERNDKIREVEDFLEQMKVFDSRWKKVKDRLRMRVD